ncbi:MAG: DUF1653 domain-containing protein [Candidatus Kerfeldbacteria bacterium CG08_land_8_20_14_0_20_40_16]|uniref:DUF1653 domain-containing protein n=1 Tax=Candidatus Kerfeldbacteria bacterium CG08_land_8_20_14_0_20_40_16 TaxID=2014244 RepID=A0A2H0YUE6_9BACT|nr:MAG: DUF1653 domain-containing protein [Candidatus Kerfeldbacteria bacterium CG08_land_8_20_14_0_20_40_16]
MKTGNHKHYKGKKYKVIGIALHSETKEKFVTYQSLHGSKKLWLRPLKMFTGKVKVDGRLVSRFKIMKK